MNEANARFLINKLLTDAGWRLVDDERGRANVRPEMRNEGGVADYVLKDKSDFPLCVLEAKEELKHPLTGKEQSRKYAQSLNCRYVILSNSIHHYLWDIENGSPTVIQKFSTQEQLELSKLHFNPPRQEDEDIGVDYIAQTQLPNFEKNPDYLNKATRDAFIKDNKLRLLRDYQLRAVKAVQRGVAEGKDRFLLEMATGTGKTLTSLVGRK